MHETTEKEGMAMKGNLLSMRKEREPTLTTWRERKDNSEKAKQRRLNNAKKNSVTRGKNTWSDDLHR